MDWLNKLVRPAVLNMKTYSTAQNEPKNAKIHAFLDTNEMQYPPFGSRPEHELNRYEAQQPEQLLNILGKLYNVPPENLLVGRGTDEGIELLVRTFCREDIDSILICPPVFDWYGIAAQAQGANIISVPLYQENGYQYDIKRIVAASTPETKLIFLPTPHAPLGHAANQEDILALCEARYHQSIIVADEAYAEFSPNPQGLIPHLKDHPNLVVLRTLSKAHMLAGERIGCVIAHPDIIQMINKILTAYPLPKTSVISAMKALSPKGQRKSAQCRETVIQERNRVAAAFSQHSDVVKVFSSVTNFIFMEVRDSNAFLARARTAGIALRDRSSELANCIRISIGTPEQNDALLKTFGLLDSRYIRPTRETKPVQKGSCSGKNNNSPSI
ncbi:MAG: histidinol-phosphate transaminase [Bdellovibrionales bacterium]